MFRRAPQFLNGDRVTVYYHADDIKVGTIIGLRNDSWEQRNASTPNYHVKFNDGTSDTYVNEAYIALPGQKSESQKLDEKIAARMAQLSSKNDEDNSITSGVRP